jgi:hypothetical protein
MIKSLDTKLASVHANPSGSKALIIADAKDADGIWHYRTLPTARR